MTTQIPEEDRELHIGESGLWIPPELRAFEGQVVFRTPRMTVQHYSSGTLEPYYAMIDASHFGSEEELDDPANPELVPNHASIKPAGEAVETFPVETDPDLKI